MKILHWFLAVILVTGLVSFAMGRLPNDMAKIYRRPPFYVLFPGQITLSGMSLLLCAAWFCTGNAYTLDYGPLMDAVERIPPESYTSVMTVLGAGSLILGWVYSERDKLTLGISQSDLVLSRFGRGYAICVIVHFAMIFLCLFMSVCKAAEAALWTALAVVWGLIPQALICVGIAMNRNRRRHLALAIWRKGGCPGGKYARARTMVRFLNQPDTYDTEHYGEVLCLLLVQWLRQRTEKAGQVAVNDVKDVSSLFLELRRTLPPERQASYEEQLLKGFCRCLDHQFAAEPPNTKPAQGREEVSQLKAEVSQNQERLKRLNAELQWVYEVSDWMAEVAAKATGESNFAAERQWIEESDWMAEVAAKATGETNFAAKQTTPELNRVKTELERLTFALNGLRYELEPFTPGAGKQETPQQQAGIPGPALQKQLCLETFSCGYCRFLYTRKKAGQGTDDLALQMQDKLYYTHFGEDDPGYKTLLWQVTRYFSGLTWLRFLYQQGPLPKKILCPQDNGAVGTRPFEALVQSLFEDDLLDEWKPPEQELPEKWELSRRVLLKQAAEISWKQIVWRPK